MESKKIKNVKVKETKYRTEEQEEIKRFIIILIIVIVLVAGVYLFTKLVIKKDKITLNEPSPATGKIDYTKVTVGTMLNKVDSEYYVIIFDSDTPSASLYQVLYSKYVSSKKSPIYLCDLNNKLNQEYISKDGNTNTKAKKIEDLSLGEVTLLKIRKGKIISYIENYDQIKTELGL